MKSVNPYSYNMAKRAIIAIFCVFLNFLSIQFAISMAENEDVAQTWSQGPENAEQLERWLNDFVPEKMDESLTPGLAFSYYKQSQAIFTQGFGVTNIESNKRVDPTSSVFRIASISKLFAPVAAMQLVEQGRLDLDQDINAYLHQFKLKSHFNKPVSMRHLFTHTAGFEDKYYADGTLEQDKHEKLGEHLQHALPNLMREPGEYVSYSNYGSALAAFVIEQITGRDFADYVRDEILLPAGMLNSGYNLTSQLEEQLVTGYLRDDGTLTPRPYTWIHRYPPTSMMTTAEDMMKFAKIFINQGMGESKRILTSESVSKILSTQFTQHPNLPGMAMAFSEFNRYGNNTFYHDGGHVGFHAIFVIIPEQNAAYFAAANLKNGSLPSDIKYEFLKTFFDNQQPYQKPERRADVDTSVYSGRYRLNRYSPSNFEKLVDLFGAATTVNIKGSEEGYIQLFDGKYWQVADNEFHLEDRDHKLIFELDGAGKVSRLFLDWGGVPRVFEKQQLLQSPLPFQVLLGLLLLASIILSVVIWRNKSRQSPGKLSALPTWLAILAGLTLVAFILGLVIYFVGADHMNIRMDRILPLKILLALPIVSLILLIGFVFTGYFNKHSRSLHRNTSHLFMVINCATFYWLLWQWNLFGYWL